MHTKELKALYEEACKAQRQEPEPAEFKMWKCVLGFYDERDVRGALVEWWGGERGMFLPKPAELKPLAASQARIRRAAESPSFCEDSALGFRLVVVEGSNTKVRCECPQCVRVRAALESKQRG